MPIKQYLPSAPKSSCGHPPHKEDRAAGAAAPEEASGGPFPPSLELPASALGADVRQFQMCPAEGSSSPGKAQSQASAGVSTVRVEGRKRDKNWRARKVSLGPNTLLHLGQPTFYFFTRCHMRFCLTKSSPAVTIATATDS